MSPFPNTRRALHDSGYEYIETKTCKCGANIEMWLTAINRRRMPLDFKQNDQGQEVCVPHFAVCEFKEDFSQRLRDKKARESGAEAGPILE